MLQTLSGIFYQALLKIPVWGRLVRFQAQDDQPYWAALDLKQADVPIGIELKSYSSIDELEQGNSGKTVKLTKILAPIPSPQNPVVCMGGNYEAHTAEAKVPQTIFPACMWLNSRFVVANHDEPVLIPKHAYDHFLDHEGELVILTSKTAKNVSLADAHKYILGYTVGNDLTAREWHKPERSSIQLGYSKGFDNFAPMGPSLISHDAWKASSYKQLKTWVNGEVVQDDSVETMVFNPEEIVSFLSQGHTIEGCSAIMTGTPRGVGWFRSPQYSLKDGDVFEIQIDPIGRLRNTMQFE